MPGPVPKDPRTLQRRNKAATRAALTSRQQRRRFPHLPRFDDYNPVTGERIGEHQWHPMTRSWWRDVWASPMAREFTRADDHGLFILAVLVDRFWTHPSKELAGEIRLQRQAFGLTPIDRRRLQWEIKAEAEPRRPAAVGTTEPITPAEDPRAALRMVK